MGFSFAFLSTCVQCNIGSFVFRSRSGSLLSLLGRLSQHGPLRAQRVGQSLNTLRRQTDETASDLASGLRNLKCGCSKEKLYSHRRKSSGLWYETIRWVWGFSRWCGAKLGHQNLNSDSLSSALSNGKSSITSFILVTSNHGSVRFGACIHKR